MSVSNLFVPNDYQLYTNNVSSTNSVTSISAAGPTVLSNLNSGQIISLGATGNNVNVSLPVTANSAGLSYRISYGVTGNNAVVTTASSENTLTGILLSPTSGVTAETNKHTITFSGTTGVLGDYVELKCDGQKWQLLGSTQAAGGISFS